MKALRAGDIMIPLDRYPYVRPNDSIRRAIHKFNEQITGRKGAQSLPRIVLVIDESGVLLGQTRRRDILQALEPPFFTQETAAPHGLGMFAVAVDPNLADVFADKIEERFKALAARPVREIMKPLAQAVEFDDSLAKVFGLLVQHDISLIPVLRGGKAVGAIRSVEALIVLDETLDD